MFKALAGTVIITGLLALLGYWYATQKLQEPLPIPSAQVFEVRSGDTLGVVADRLVQQELVDRPEWVYWVGRFYGFDRRLKVGEYRLEPGLTVVSLLEVLASGRSIQHEIRLLEGWTLRDVAAEFSRHDRLDKVVQDWSKTGLARELGLTVESAEGQLFPDTYFYHKGMSDLTVIRQANARLQTVLALAWENRAADIEVKTPYEALILASIVEKETGKPDERRVISGVFTSRLAKGMRLQTDPTVIYGLGEQFDGNLTRAHLRDKQNPYNTYAIAGLPPTPIALAGEAAILAAVNPDRQEGYLYFVARGDGSHAFSRTLEAHNRAVREYQLRRRDDYRSH